MKALSFAEIWIGAYAAHMAVDHIAQTDKQAACKSGPSASDWRHALTHGGQHALGTAAAVTLLARGLGAAAPSARGLIAGLGFIGATHTFIDRRRPVLWLMRRTGSAEFAKGEGPIYGPYLVDQSLHIACLTIGALIIARSNRRSAA